MTYYRYPRRRPPWWPPDQPWPPSGPPDAVTTRRMTRHFVRRVGCLFVLLFILAFSGLLTVITAVVETVGGAPSPFPFFAARPAVAIPIVLIIIGIFVTIRALMSIAAPVSDLMHAVGRVAEGDYAARASERGPHDIRSLARAFNSMAERLQRTDEQRRNLLADVTHELRTPLTVIQGNLEGLIDGVYPRDDAHLTPILEETRLLSRLIDDLRTLALAESGALKLAKERTDLGALIAETIASFEPRAQTAHVRLETDLAPDVMLDLDPARIREVLENALANALRYTPEGGAVAVKTGVEGEESQAAFITISDSGRGIPAEDLPHIFDRFYKSADSRGTGLGLAIAKNLIAAHGGSIAAESAEGQGTTIRILLPIPHTNQE